MENNIMIIGFYFIPYKTDFRPKLDLVIEPAYSTLLLGSEVWDHFVL